MGTRDSFPKLAALMLTIGILLDAGSAQTVNTVYSFTASNQSGHPSATLTQGRNGDLYGTTSGTGGVGSIYALATDGQEHRCVDTPVSLPAPAQSLIELNQCEELVALRLGQS